MKRSKLVAMAIATTALATLLLLCGSAAAQSMEVQGVIDGRSGATMTVKTLDGNVVVLLTDMTQVEEVEGGLHLRKKQMAMTALVARPAGAGEGFLQSPEPVSGGQRQVQGL